MSRLIAALLCLCTLVVLSSPAEAQRYGSRRTPGFTTQPAISPYINLFNPNTGGINNYFTFVRPQLRLENYLRQENQRIYENNLMIRQEATERQRSIDSEVEDQILELRATGGGVQRRAGSFMRYEPFFPQGGAAQFQSYR